MDKFDWNAALHSSLPAEWLDARGANVKIAVIDTGVDLSHPNLLHLRQKQHTFYPAQTGFAAERWRDFGNAGVPDLYNQPPDPPGHGTQCVSILAARPTDTTLIQGIAPEAEVFIIKTTNASGLSNSVLRCFLDALNAAVAIKPDIILASLAFHQFGLVRERIRETEVDAVFKAVADNNILMFSAVKNAGDDATAFDIDAYFPSKRPECINTVAAPKWLAAGLPGLEAADALHFMVDCREGMICKPGNRLADVPQSLPNSYANYIVGGIAAAYLSFLKKGADRDLPLSKARFLAAVHDKFSPLADALTAAAGIRIYRNFNQPQPDHA